MYKTNVQFLLLFVGIAALLFSCDGTENTPSVEDVWECDLLEIDDFHSFLGLEYGMEEHELKATLGDFTGGRFTADSSEFIYYFNRVERAPLSVWVDVESHRVVTIFIELIGLRDAFELDRATFLEEFLVSECDASWIGARDMVIRERLKIPESDVIDTEGVLSLLYSTQKNDCKVMFKFYPEQDQKCSSIVVNWVYN